MKSISSQWKRRIHVVWSNFQNNDCGACFRAKVLQNVNLMLIGSYVKEYTRRSLSYELLKLSLYKCSNADEILWFNWEKNEVHAVFETWLCSFSVQKSKILHFFQFCHVLGKTCSFDNYVKLSRPYIITFTEHFLSNAQKLRRSYF